MRCTVRLRALTAVALAALAVGGCGVAAESTPRDINDAVGDATTQSSIPSEGSGQIFLVQPNASGDPSRLVPVSRDLQGDPTSVFELLMVGATPAEQDEGTSSLLPAALELREATVRNGIVTLDLSSELADMSGQQQIFALAQLVHTFDGLPGVDGVRITTEGRATAWPNVNGQLQTGELTVFDYPGLLRTTQPAFPAVPSG